MSRHLCLLMTALLTGALCVSSAGAQQPGGTITGTINNAAQEVMPGASVKLEPGHIAVTANGQGRFTLLRVTPGTYTLTASYVGFEAQTKRIAVRAGETTPVDFILQVPARSQTVVVSAPRPYGAAEAINVERASDNVLDVLPAKVITSLPNANIADALGRLPGVTLERDEGEGKYVQIRGTEPRLSNVTVDGVEVPAPESGIRQVKLDVIPADLVDSVQINKTLEADQNGDAIGGSVNLVTKTASRAPQVSLYANGGFTPIADTRHAGEAGGTVGNSFGSRKQFGVIVSGSWDYNGRGIDDVEPVPSILAGTTFTPGYSAADIREYLYNRHRYGFGGSADDKLNSNSTVYLRGLFSDFKDGGKRTVYSLSTNDTIPGANTPSAASELRIGDYQIGTLILGGNHSLPESDAWINWQASVGRSRMLNPLFDDTASFNYTGSTSNCQYDATATTNPYEPQFTPACFTEAYNPGNFLLSRIKHGNHGISAKLDLAAKFDVSKNYHTSTKFGTLQFGAQVRNSHQFDDSWETDYAPASAIPASQFVNGFKNPNYYGGAYPSGPFFDYSLIDSFLQSHPGNFTMTSTQGGNPNNFDLIERISSAYLMNTIDLGRFRIYGGLRMEGTDVNTLSFDQTVGTLSAKGTFSYVDLLPSASLQYKLDENSDLRFAVGRGLSRPDPYYLTSAISLDTSTNPETYSIGNPALKPEHGIDYDLLYERYLTPLGMVRAGYFYKRLSNPIVQPVTQPTAGPYTGFRVNQPANGGNAWVSGFEVSFEQQFTYFPGLLRGLGVSGNYSYSTSRAHDVAPGVRSDSPALLRQAPNTWNLSPTYDLGRFSGRVGMAYNGASIFQYNYADGVQGGLQGPYGDVYLYPHFQVDAQVSVRIGHGVSLLVSVLNLNNEVFGFYQGSPQFPIQREFYKPTYSIGIRWNLFHE